MSIYDLIFIAFCFIGIYAIIRAIISVFKKTNTDLQNMQSEVKNENQEARIKKSLDVLKSNKGERKKARAFVVLMETAYVLVHTLVNHGNKYDDGVQSRSFCSSMTPDLAEKLNSVEGIYG